MSHPPPFIGLSMLTRLRTTSSTGVVPVLSGVVALFAAFLFLAVNP